MRGPRFFSGPMLTPDSLERVQDQYDVHFISASKNPADIPRVLDYGDL
jgi:hypothetical protein